MTQPTPYTKIHSFVGFSGSPAYNWLEEELIAIEQTLDQLCANLALIQRDDKELANSVVGHDQLKAEVNIGFNPPTVWQASTDYDIRDLVINGQKLYRAGHDHTSASTIQSDIDAGKLVFMMEFVGVQGPAGPQGAQGSQGIQGVQGNQGSQGSQGIQGDQGIQGPQGNPGADGAAGSKIYSGSGAPAGGTGVVGDWYLNDSNGDFYEKTGASTWTLRDNLTGPQGIQGVQGTQGTQGNPGLGVPVGGTTAQILRKIDNTDNNTEWHSLLKGDVGLGNVDNTSDANKPVSTATQTALDLKAAAAHTHAQADVTNLVTDLALKAPLASPTFTGTVIVPDDSFALSKIANIATARILGRNTAATGDIEELTAADAKTVLALVKGDVGLGNVDNTSDASKPVSTATQTALDGKQASGATLTSLEGLSLVSGDILYATAADTLARLAKGSDADVLTLAGGLPSWVAPGAGSGEPLHKGVYLTSNNTLTSQTAAQPIFDGGGGPANGRITLAANKTYRFKALIHVASMSATSGNAAFSFGGTATITRQKFQHRAIDATTLSTISAAWTEALNTAATAASMATAGTGTAMCFELEGILRIGAGGTLIPQIALVTAAAAVVQTDSWFEIWEIGADTVATVGTGWD